MRTTIINNVSIKYADKIGFAFMPCVLIAKASNIGVVTISIYTSEKKYTFKIYGNNGIAVIDYREYIQSFFRDVKFGDIDYSDTKQLSQLGKTINVLVNVYDNSTFDITASFHFATFYVWGAMKTNEIWNACKRLKWFTHYPFSFGLYTDNKTNIFIGKEYHPKSYITLPSKGLYDITSQNLDENADFAIIYNYEGEIKQTTFSDVYDFTFRLEQGKQSIIMRIDYDDSEEGVYLRWIDRHGFYRYWLFTQGDEERAISSDMSFIRNNLLEYDDTYCYYGDNGRKQGYEREDTIALCAPLIDSATFDFLQDVTSSPVVDMYLGNNKWQSVTIKAGSYTKTTAILQDFVCNLVLNNINIQHL